MSKNTSISALPRINNIEIIKNLNVDKRYIIDPKGLNVPISVAMFTKIRELYSLKVMKGEDVKNIVLDIQLNRNGRFFLHSISMVKGKFIMKISDCERNEFTFCDFEKDILRVLSENYIERMRLNQKEKYNLKKSKNHYGNKNRSEGYSQVETTKKTVTNINPNVQRYIKRIIPIFRNITDDAAFMDILHVFIKSGELKSHVDANEVEKMRNEFSEMKKEISVMSDALALFA